MSQVRAIISGKEVISTDLIRLVAKENLKLVRPMIEALKSGNAKKIAHYEDIYMVDFEEFYKSEKQNLDLSSRIKEIKTMKNQKQANENITKKEQSVIKLLELDVEADKAEKIVDKIIKKEGGDITVKDIVIKALQTLAGITEVKNKIRKNTVTYTNDNDLRGIVEAGLKKNLSAYESLMEEGYIKSFEFDLDGLGV